MTFDLSRLTVGELIHLQRALLDNDLAGALEILERHIPNARDIPVAEFFPALRDALEKLLPKS